MKRHEHMTDDDATAVLRWVEATGRILTPGRSGAPTGEDEAVATNRRR